MNKEAKRKKLVNEIESLSEKGIIAVRAGLYSSAIHDFGKIETRLFELYAFDSEIERLKK